MKKLPLIILFLISYCLVTAQRNFLDSIRAVINSTQNDSLKMKQFIILTEFYRQTNTDSSFHYAKRLRDISQKLDLKLNEGYALAFMGFALNYQNKFVEALKLFNTATALLEDPKSEQRILHNEYSVDEDLYDHQLNPHLQRLEKLANLKLIMVMLYNNVKDSAKEFELIRDASALSIACGNERINANASLLASIGYYDFKLYPKALNAAQEAYQQSIHSHLTKYLGSVMLRLGHVYKNLGQRDKAIQYYWQAIQYSRPNYLRGVFAADLELSNWHLQLLQMDSSLWYARDAQIIAETLNLPDLKLRVDTSLLAFYHALVAKDSILKYQSMIIRYKDTTSSSQVKFQVALNTFKDEQHKQDEIAAARKEYQNRVRTYAFIIGFAIVFLFSFILWRNNRRTHIANKQLIIQKKETENQKAKVEQALNTLKLTQGQLIQSEKMASLGELTAGIAHEIQNPLNFVNNFSEVNDELLAEMEAELKSGHTSEAIALATDVRQNMKRINQHGKRAEGIVSGMLQHSRPSAGERQLTDINALAEEYLRLSLHGMKAKENSFQCEIKKDLDLSIGKISAIPQDLGRVFLNICNNAFYSVNEKKKKQGDGFEPMVQVSSKKSDHIVEFHIRDNGLGIPQKDIDKIFQPFFTTKPTGQGTGLGLSLAYDIVTKEHQGSLSVESFENEGAEFIIQIAIT
jgi:signal transduction histidine kinase